MMDLHLYSVFWTRWVLGEGGKPCILFFFFFFFEPLGFILYISYILCGGPWALLIKLCLIYPKKKKKKNPLCVLQNGWFCLVRSLGDIFLLFFSFWCILPIHLGAPFGVSFFSNKDMLLTYQKEKLSHDTKMGPCEDYHKWKKIATR